MSTTATGQKGCHMCGDFVLKKKHKKKLCKCRKFVHEECFYKADYPCGHKE